MADKMSKKCSNFAPDIHKITIILSQKKKKAMRRIQFLAPVESMRGNLSGEQNLLYPTQDNSAWEAPSNKRSYATNYKPRYIGSRRSATGKNYFAIKERTAVTNSDSQRRTQALLGATRSLAIAIQANPTALQVIQTAFGRQTRFDTLKKFVEAFIREGLENYYDFQVYGDTGGVTVYKNPYLKNHATGALAFPNMDPITDVLVKFWTILGDANIFFTISKAKGIAHTSDTFDNVIESNYNVLGLAVDGEDHVTIYGGAFNVYDGDAIVAVSEVISSSTEYSIRQAE